MMDSRRRTLGSNGAALETSAQGFGCMGITSFYGRPIADADAVALLSHAFAHGVTHFDTAEVYTALADDGVTVLYNESVVGMALAHIGQRDRIQIATKYYPSLHGPTMTSEDVISACKASCARLQVAKVDLYYVHRLHATVPVEDQARAMLACKEAGLCDFVGVSEFSPANLRAFHAICPVTCVQQEWSLVNRDLEAELVPCCRELGIGIVAYSPLCRSLLCGAVASAADLNGSADLRPLRYPRFAPENLAKNAALVAEVKAMAAARGLTPAQLSLAWVSSQGGDVVPIPGTTKIAHLDDNLASRAVALSEAQREAVAACVPSGDFSGDRFAGGRHANTFKAQMTATAATAVGCPAADPAAPALVAAADARCGAEAAAAAAAGAVSPGGEGEGLLCLVVTAEVKPDRVGDFLAAIKVDAEGSRKEPGCRRFDVLRDDRDANKFVFYEVYLDAAAFAAHQTRDHVLPMTAFVASGGLAAPMAVALYAGVYVELASAAIPEALPPLPADSVAPPMVLVVSVEVAPGRAGELVALMRGNAEGSRKEAGCRRFDVLRDDRDPGTENRFVFYVAYADAAAVASHLAEPHAAPWLAFKAGGGVVSQAVVSAKGVYFGGALRGI